jgi:hypothetical protein
MNMQRARCGPKPARSCRGQGSVRRSAGPSVQSPGASPAISRTLPAEKQAGLDLAAMEQFYKIYGEFFAVWKLWEDAIQRNGGKRNERLSVPFWEVREPFREVRPIAPAGR